MTTLEESEKLTHAGFLAEDGTKFDYFNSAASYAESMTIRDKSVIEFFALGELWRDRTLFNEIRFDGTRTHVIYSPQFTKTKNAHGVNLANQLRSIMQRANEEESGRFGMLLSGGLDSRSVIAAAPEDMFSESYTFGDPNSDDAIIAKEVAEVLNVKKHTMIEVDLNRLRSDFKEVIDSCGGAWGILQSHSIQIAEEIRKHTDIAVNGYGTDIMLGGNALLVANSPEKYFSTRRMFSDSELNNLLSPSVAAIVKPTLKEIESFEIDSLRSKAQYDRTDEIAMSAHIAANNIGYILPRTSYQVFSPHAHPDFVNAAEKVPSVFRAFHSVYSPMMKELSKDVAKIPYPSEKFPITYPTMMRIAGRVAVSAKRKLNRKLGKPNKNDYLDIRSWWNDVPQWRSAVVDAALLDNDLLRREFIEDMIKQQDSGSRDNVVKIAHIATFNLACKRFSK